MAVARPKKPLRQGDTEFYPLTHASQVLFDNGKTLVDVIYPVGSIYMAVNSTNPSTLFGGTWEQLQDRFLLGAGTSYDNGATGGEATHTLTIDEMPAHQHQNYYTWSGSGSVGGNWKINMTNTANGGAGQWPNASGLSTNVAITGGGQAHNNMPPYLVVYMWKRTA